MNSLLLRIKASKHILAGHGLSIEVLEAGLPLLPGPVNYAKHLTNETLNGSPYVMIVGRRSQATGEAISLKLALANSVRSRGLKCISVTDASVDINVSARHFV